MAAGNQKGNIMLTLNEFVTVAFWNTDRRVFCNVNFFSEASQKRVIVGLTDLDHQSLIDTLEKVWPNWSDANQDTTRGE